jgi:hypothetical protein
MQALVAHADRAGRCWPGVRRIAEITGVPKSTVARYLTALERAGHISRARKLGGRCTYTIAARFLPAARVSQNRDQAVPSARTEEKLTKKNSDFHDDSAQWRARLGAWHSSGGRFWNAFWGPKPSEPGCFAPIAVLRPGG